jgi:hypothetical protein
MSLHVFFNEQEWVIANDKEDALTVWYEQIGEKREDYEDEIEWQELADEQTLKLFDETDPETNGKTPTEKTAKEWTEVFGRGLLGSTEY